MASLPSKFYHVRSNCGQFEGLFSSKSKLYAALISSGDYRPLFITDYRSLSELLKLNSVFRTQTLCGYLVITTIKPNRCFVHDRALPPFQFI